MESKRKCVLCGLWGTDAEFSKIKSRKDCPYKSESCIQVRDNQHEVEPKAGEVMCYKSGEPCKYDCQGLCKESC